MRRTLDDTQAELDAFVQKTRLLEPLVAEEEILRRDLMQSAVELTTVKLERDMAKGSVNELIAEHHKIMEGLRKEQETVMALLEAQQKENLEQLVREAALAQELLTVKHREDLANALRHSVSISQAEQEKNEDLTKLHLEISSIRSEIGALRHTIETQAIEIAELASEKTVLAKELTAAKTEVDLAVKELQEAKVLSTKESDLAFSKNDAGAICKHPECHEPATMVLSTTETTATKSRGSSKDVVTKREFSWAQFFPMSKMHLQQVNSNRSFGSNPFASVSYVSLALYFMSTK